MKKIVNRPLILSLFLAICHTCFSQTATPGDGANQGTKAPGQGTINKGALNTHKGGKDTAMLMPGWRLESMPDVKNDHRSAGTVVIDFTVNTTGEIIETHANAKHTTVTDTTLIKKCEAAVKKIKLAANGPVTTIQKGQLHFKFDVH